MSVVKWSTAQIPDMHGKVTVITGANSGIGWETARALAGRGAQVVMAVRSRTNGLAARNAVLREHPDAVIEVMDLDLSSLQSIEQFAERFRDRYSTLSLLVNNAGVMADRTHKRWMRLSCSSAPTISVISP